MAFKPKFKQGNPKKCWCGSGKDTANCHGLNPGMASARPQPAPNPIPKAATTAVRTPQMAWGVPGEEHKIFVAPVYKDQRDRPFMRIWLAKRGSIKSK